MSDDLLDQNRVLRERVAQLEKGLASGTDPILRSLSEHAAAYLNVVTPEGRFLATGRPSEGFGSVIGRSVLEFVEPQYVPLMRDLFARVAATGRAESFESVGYGEDGSPGHAYLTRAVPLRDGDKTAALVLVPTDITERVRLERSLVEKEEALRFAVQASHMGLWSWDVTNGVITWDDRMREIWGVSETPRDYAQYMATLHPDDRELVQRAISDALTTGVYPTIEHRVRVNGEERWVLGVASVVKDASGKPTRVLGGALDITEQKRLAAQHGRAARVESIGQLTAGIAHNFNNLLAVILPNIELLLSNATEAQRGGLSAVLSASLQARDLVRNLMSLTQRDDARSLAPADPHDVIERVATICRVTFPREISLRHEVASNIGHVSMPSGDLEQVLLNLLFNARDAIEQSTGPRREIEIRGELVAGSDGAPSLQLSVSDTGVGMTEDVRARVFEPFFTTKPPHKGSGLGLANAAARVKDAGGSIRCASTPGVSTTFTLTLPLRDVPRAQSPLPGGPAKAAVGGETLLLVDDEPLVRSVMRRLLEREGYKVLEADSAQKGREILQQQGVAVDLVILDQSMPRETGTQALPSIRALTKAPVILFTGMAPDLAEGIAAVLEKPARPDELHRVVRGVLDKGRSMSSGA